MLFGSVPWPPRKPRSSTSTQSARQNTAAPMTAIRASRASERAALTQNAAPAAASAITATRFTANPWDSVKLPKPETITSSACGCGVPAIDWIIAVSEPGWPSSRALPEAAPGPRLQQRHAEEEDPAAAEDEPADRGPFPAALREQQQRAGHDVEENGARRAEEHGEAGGQDRAERLAERPDDQPPGHARQRRQPERPAAHREDHPEPDADLDPDRRRGGRDGVVAPDVRAPVHHVHHPAGRAAVGRLEQGGHAPRHLRLRLQQPVEHPQGAEADPQHLPRAGLTPGGVRALVADRRSHDGPRRDARRRRSARRSAPAAAAPSGTPRRGSSWQGSGPSSCQACGHLTGGTARARAARANMNIM